MIMNKIYNPINFEVSYKLFTEQRSGLMKIRNWLWTLDTNWSLHVFCDTDPTQRVVYGRDWVIQTINEVIENHLYNEDQKQILNSIRAEYIYNGTN